MATVPETRRLQFGCGAFPATGWINTNLLPGPGVNLACDIRSGLPLASESIGYITSMHALVELPYLDVVPALRELRRVLVPGGVLRLGLPDLDRAIDAYRAGSARYFSIPDDETASIDGKFVVQMTWYGTNLMMFTFEFARELLLRAGFSDVSRSEFRQTTSPYPEIVAVDNRPKESFFLEAIK
ncbi:MAG: methyltransferase domain-containing protein [Chloroflexota bacterium]